MTEGSSEGFGTAPRLQNTVNFLRSRTVRVARASDNELRPSRPFFLWTGSGVCELALF